MRNTVSLQPVVMRLFECVDITKMFLPTRVDDIHKKGSMFRGMKANAKSYTAQSADLYGVLVRKNKPAVMASLGLTRIFLPDGATTVDLWAHKGDGVSLIAKWLIVAMNYDIEDVDSLEGLIKKIPFQIVDGAILKVTKETRPYIRRAVELDITVSWAKGITKICDSLLTLDVRKIDFYANTWMNLASAIKNGKASSKDGETEDWETELAYNSLTVYDTFFASWRHW